MALNLITFGDSLKNLIEKNNTTTSSYNISAGLNEKVKQVVRGYHEIKPILNINFPSVFVELNNKQEEFAQLGRTDRRNISLNYNIVGVTDYGLGQPDGREASDDEMIRLSSNLESLFRTFPKLSNTTQVLQALVSNVNYDVSESNDTYNSIVEITLTIDLYSN